MRTSICQLILAEHKKHAILDKQIADLENTNNKKPNMDINADVNPHWDNTSREDITRTLFNYYMKKHNVSSTWQLKYDNACTRCGLTNYKTKTIQLSKQYINSNQTSKGEIINTILHEIAHIICPNQQHNSIWKAKALEIGCDGKVCNDIKPFAKPKWLLKCKKGCYYSERYRKSNMNNKWCTICKESVTFTKA